MSLYTELDSLKLAELISRFQEPAPEGKEYAAAYYDEVAALIEEKGEAGLKFLDSQLPIADKDRLGAILLALATPGHPLSKVMLLKYLHDKRPYIIVRAIDGLWRQGQSDASNEVLALRNHPDAWVRGAVLRFMRHIQPEAAVPILLEALQDPHYIVRENAIDELDELEAITALPYIRPFLQDQPKDVRAAARLAVEHFEDATRGLAVS